MSEQLFSEAMSELSDKYITEAIEYQYNKQSVKGRGYSFLKRINTAPKRIATVAAIAVFVMFSSAMSVSAFREPFIEMIQTIFGNHVELSFDGDKKDAITEVYGIGYIPEGFEPIKESISDSAVFKDYEDSDGNIISFSQMITGNDTTVDVDNEQSKNYTINVDGVEIFITEGIRDDIKAAFWGVDGYSFNLTYIGDIELDELTEVISSVYVVELRELEE